jgi:hypothetical protein
VLYSVTTTTTTITATTTTATATATSSSSSTSNPNTDCIFRLGHDLNLKLCAAKIVLYFLFGIHHHHHHHHHNHHHCHQWHYTPKWALTFSRTSEIQYVYSSMFKADIFVNGKI